jgi:hypothetical protein
LNGEFGEFVSLQQHCEANAQNATHDRPSRQSQPFSELEVIVEKDHKKLLACKVLIERRKQTQTNSLNGEF